MTEKKDPTNRVHFNSNKMHTFERRERVIYYAEAKQLAYSKLDYGRKRTFPKKYIYFQHLSMNALNVIEFFLNRDAQKPLKLDIAKTNPVNFKFRLSGFVPYISTNMISLKMG